MAGLYRELANVVHGPHCVGACHRINLAEVRRLHEVVVTRDAEIVQLKTALEPFEWLTAWMTSQPLIEFGEVELMPHVGGEITVRLGSPPRAVEGHAHVLSDAVREALQQDEVGKMMQRWVDASAAPSDTAK